MGYDDLAISKMNSGLKSCIFDLSFLDFFFFLKSRVVGGLLSAYDLSEDKLFLEKARDIADRLLPAWNTPSGIPYNIINLAHGNAHNPGWTGVSVWFLVVLLSLFIGKLFYLSIYLFVYYCLLLIYYSILSCVML